MELQIKTNITQSVSDLLSNQVLLNNTFIGTDENTAPDFIVDNVDVKQFELDTTEASTFTLNLFDNIQPSPDKTTFIHIFAFNTTDGSTECPVPVKFQLDVTDGTNTIALGNVSQFELANMDTFPVAGDLIISNLAVATDKKAALIIIVGLTN